MNGKNFFASLVMLVALASAGLAQTPSSCPNNVKFGVHPVKGINESIRAEVEVTYFDTDDPNEFISERAGINRSASFTVRDAGEFVARLRGLEGNGLARIQKRQSATSYMNETALLNLERDAFGVNGGTINASLRQAADDLTLDRETEVTVTQNPRTDGDSYRLNLLSWFVDAMAGRGGSKTVDYDGSMLLKPGQTLIVKLFSPHELKRGGAGRKYVAVTLRSVTPVGLARK